MMVRCVRECFSVFLGGVPNAFVFCVCGKTTELEKQCLAHKLECWGCPPCVYFEGSGNTGNSASVFLIGDVFPFLQFVSVHALSNSGQWNCWKHLALSWRLLLQCCQNKCMVVILASQRTLCQIQKILVLSGPHLKATCSQSNQAFPSAQLKWKS